MRKRVQLLVLLALTIFSWGCSSEKKEDNPTQNSVAMKGTVRNGEGRTLYLHLLSVDTTGVGGMEYVGLSNSVIENGAFELTCQPDDAEPQFYRIGFGGQNTITTIARRGEELTFTFNNSDTLCRNYKVKGGEDAQLMWELDQRLSRFIDSAEHLTLWYEYSDDDSSHVLINNAYTLIKGHHRDFLSHFIADHPTSLATITAFYQTYQMGTFFDEVADVALLEKIYTNLKKQYPRNGNVIWLSQRIAFIHKNIENQQNKENNSL